jgi:HEAT repeat protein
MLLVKIRAVRMAAGVLIGLLMIAVAIWVLSKNMGNLHETLYAGHPLSYWQQQLEGRDVGASNAAYAVVNAQIVPQLIDTMLHDTNDSKIRLGVIGALDKLPGIQISYTEASGRRSGAAGDLGRFGPAAKAAVPSLVRSLKAPEGVHEAAIYALGSIHSDPDVVIPLLISYLTNEDLDDKAAWALGKYGSLAKEAFPRILPLYKGGDKDARAAARVALKLIDPAAAKKAGVK